MSICFSDKRNLSLESETCSEWRPISSRSFHGHNKSSKSPPSVAKVVTKTGRWLLYSSDNIILGLIVVEQMSLWVGLTRRAAETFLYHPPHTFNGIERLQKGKGEALNDQFLLDIRKL